MPHTLSIMEARKQLTSLPETLFHDGQLDVLEITRRGKPVLAVLPWELYEAVDALINEMRRTKAREEWTIENQAALSERYRQLESEGGTAAERLYGALPSQEN